MQKISKWFNDASDRFLQTDLQSVFTGKISAQFTRKQCQWTLVEEYFFSPPEWAAFA